MADNNETVNSVFDMIEDRTRNRNVISNNLPLVAQNTINDVKTYWNLQNTSLEKDVVDKVVMYTEQKDDYEVYKTYAKALINDQFVVSKEIENAITEIYNWFKGKNFTDRTADTLTKINTGYAPTIKITNEDRIGSILDLEIGSMRKSIFEIQGDSSSDLKLSGEVVVSYNSVRNGNTTLTNDIRRIDSLLDGFKYDINELRKYNDRINEILNELRNTGVLDDKYATKLDINKAIDDHINGDYKHITQTQIDSIDSIDKIKNDLSTHIIKYHITESEMNQVRDILNMNLVNTIIDIYGAIDTKVDSNYVTNALKNFVTKTEFENNNIEIENNINDAWVAIQLLNDLHPTSSVHVTNDERGVWNAKYTLPADGIPMKDLSNEVKDRLSNTGAIVDINIANEGQINALFF